MQGQVFLIQERDSSKYLAAKIYETTDEEKIVSIKNEAQILAVLSHPNIVQFKRFYCQEKEGLFIIVTEYFPSVSLETWILTKSLSDAEKMDITRFLINVVLYLQENNITHGDFNLSNILINPETLQIKLIDFGLSKHFLVGNANMQSPKGFLIYRPPLQLEMFYQSDLYDLWGLGLVLMSVFLGRNVCSKSLMKFMEESASEIEGNNKICQYICEILLQKRKIENGAIDVLKNISRRFC